MDKYAEAYRRKLCTPQQAAMLVREGDWVDYGMAFNTPLLFDRALAGRAGELRGVNLRGGMALHPLAVVEADPEGEHFRYHSWHLSGVERHYADQGRCSYLPMNYSSQPKLYREFLSVDVACVCVTPMDQQGYFNLSLTHSSTRTILERAKTVIVEVHEGLPWACGSPEGRVHLSQVDHIIEGAHPPLAALEPAPPTPEEQAIAAHICPRIRDGSVLQLGIGGIPNAVGSLMAQSEVKDLGMHTELLCDAYLALHRAGKLTNGRKNFDRGRGVWSFALGSQALYDWVDRNQDLAAAPVDYTNRPDILARHHRLVSINSCLEVDLWGQTGAEGAGTRQISGTGGQLDFLYGAFLSQGGQGFLCLTSTWREPKSGTLRSRIVPALEGPVTDPRSHAFLLVTEWGVAELAGQSLWDRAERIIGVAHPQFREELIRAAEARGIWRRSNRIPI